MASIQSEILYYLTKFLFLHLFIVKYLFFLRNEQKRQKEIERKLLESSKIRAEQVKICNFQTRVFPSTFRVPTYLTMHIKYNFR
jgi:hypothetical protein